MRYRIRKATIESMPEAARVFRTSFDHTYPHFPQLHTPDEDLAFYTNTVFPNNEIYLAEDESGRVIGLIAFNRDLISHLYLLPEAQRMGIGGALLKLALEQSDRLQLWTFQENIGARTFYETHGFTAIRETDGADNEERQPDVLYEWKR